MRVAITSHRPHAQSKAYAKNQVAALETWLPLFDKIVYFGPFEEALERPSVMFRDSEQWPRIKTMAHYATEQRALTTIINSDIQLDPYYARVQDILERSSLECGTSRRITIGEDNYRNEDRGRDVFCLRRRWWKRVRREVPERLRMGHQAWDTWFVGFLRHEAKTAFADFGPAKCVFHPAHGERSMPFAAEVGVPEGPYFGYWIGIPDPKIAR